MTDLLEAGLAGAERIVPALRQLLARRSEEPAPVIEPSRRGPPTARVCRPDGSEVWLHSRNDPEREARRLVEGIEADPLCTYIVLGLGLGYHLTALLERLPTGAPVVVIERSPHLVREFLRRTPWPPDRRLYLLPAIVPDEVYLLLRDRMEELLLGRVIFVEHPASVQAFEAEYDALRVGVTRWVQSASVAMLTVMALGKRLMTNRFANLRHYLSSAGIAPLRNRAAGTPVVVASAGPSLRKNLHVLAAHQHEVVIVAVSTALKALLGAGVRPDFTAVLDYHSVSRRYFEDLPSGRPIPMIADARATPFGVRAHPGPHLFFEDQYLAEMFPDDAGRRGDLRIGSTVAHLATEFALFLGASPVILVGQDLSYSHNITHVPGTAIHSEWMPRTNRFCTLETLEWRALMGNKANLIRVPDCDGNSIYTDQSMLSYLKEFNTICAAFPGRIVNATEGGASMHGARHATLAEVLAPCAGRPKPTLYRDEELKPVMLAGVPQRIAQARRRLTALRDAFREVETLTEKILRIHTEGRDADDVVRQIRKVERTCAEHVALVPVVMTVDPTAEIDAMRWSRIVRAQGSKGRDLQNAQAEGERRRMGARAAACEFVLELIAQAEAAAKEEA